MPKSVHGRAGLMWVSPPAHIFSVSRKSVGHRWIAAVRTYDVRIVASPEDLCTSFSSFYQSLFSPDAGAQESLLDNFESSLPAVQSESCEGLLSIEECFEALSGMAKCKAQGLDGLPAEFYFKFWHVLRQDLVHVLNSCYTAGSLTLSQRRGVVSELAVVPRVFVYLLNLAKYFLWRARNDYRFRAVQPGALPMIEVIMARAKCLLCVFFKRFRSSRCQRCFHRQWGANGVVGRVLECSFYFRLYLVWFSWSPCCTGLPSCLSECVCGFLVAFVGCTRSPSILSECVCVFLVASVGCTESPSILSEYVCGFLVAFVGCTGSPSCSSECISGLFMSVFSLLLVQFQFTF